MIKLLSGLILICSTAFSSFGQADSLLHTLPKPNFRWGLPNEVLISPDNRYFLVGYDYKPAYIELYELEGFKKLMTFEIKGRFTYLSSSFFHADNTEAYIDIGKPININFDIGRWSIGKEKTNYIRFNLKTGERKKVKCKNAPKGCDYPAASPYRNDIDREYLTFDSALVFKIQANKVNIYKRYGKP